MTFNEGIVEYEKMMRSKNKSSNTIKNVKYTLGMFRDIYNYKDLSDIQNSISYDFPNKLKERGIAGTSSNIYLNQVKKFLDFLKQYDYMETDIGSLITLIPRSDAFVQIGKKQFINERGKVGRVFTKEEIDIVRKAAGILYFDQPKYRLMIELLLIGGFRISEILNFKLKNIDFKTGLITIKRKRNKIHRFYLGWPELVEQVRRYCYSYNINDSEDLLFPRKSDKYTPMPYNSIANVFKKIFNAAQLEYGKEHGGFTTHDFRRTCASLLSANGLTLEEIKDILGHEDIRTTAGYITPVINERIIERQKTAVGKAFYDN